MVCAMVSEAGTGYGSGRNSEDYFACLYGNNFHTCVRMESHLLIALQMRETGEGHTRG